MILRRGRPDDRLRHLAGSHQDKSAVCDLSVRAWPGPPAAVRCLSNARLDRQEEAR